MRINGSSTASSVCRSDAAPRPPARCAAERSRASTAGRAFNPVLQRSSLLENGGQQRAEGRFPVLDHPPRSLSALGASVPRPAINSSPAVCGMNNATGAAAMVSGGADDQEGDAEVGRQRRCAVTGINAGQFQRDRAGRYPNRRRKLLAGGVEAGRGAHPGPDDTSPYANVLYAVNCKERRKPPTSSTPYIAAAGQVGRNVAPKPSMTPEIRPRSRARCRGIRTSAGLAARPVSCTARRRNRRT